MNEKIDKYLIVIVDENKMIGGFYEILIN